MKTKPFLIAVSVSIFFIVNVSAQTPVWTWAKRAGAVGTDIGYGIAIDKTGYIYTTGQFISSSITFDATTLTSAGQADIFVTKHDAYGNLVWAKSFGSNKPESAQGIAVDSAGNIYITGHFYSNLVTFGSYTVTNTTTTGALDDIYLVKMDSSGTPLWAKSAGNTGRDVAVDIAVDANNHLVIGGWFNSATLSFGSTVLTNRGGHDTFIAKYDSSGNLLWAAGAGGSGDDYCTGVGADPFGNYYLTGYFRSDSLTVGSVVLINTSSGTDDAFLVKYDSAGIQKWEKNPAGSSYDQGLAVTGGPNGDVYLTGSFVDTLSLGGPLPVISATTNQTDIFLAAYDSTGTALWLRRAGGPGSNEAGQALITDASGNIYLTGILRAQMTFDSVAYNSAGGVFVAKYSSAGIFQWANSAGGALSYQSNSIVQDVYGGLYITGLMHDGITSFGPISLTSGGGQDIFIAKLYQDIENGQPFISGDRNLKIFPNPAQDLVMVSGDKLAEGKVVLLDMTGRMIRSQSLSGGSASFDVSGIPKGIYILEFEVRDAMGPSPSKIVIQ